ncbi:dolichol kinase [Natronorarus salvus]|uniref:dolichol kinase n=1 Tax=Natronorarus salvus TaxID=3117733 RepID=UPI002F267E6D
MTEIGRRLVHSSGVLAPAAYLLGILTWDQLIALLVLGVGVAAVLEVVRLRHGLDWWIYENLTREYEQEKVAGYALYMVGFAFLALLFAPAIAIPGMLMLAIGDPVSGFLGKTFGDGGLSRKPVPVLVATFVVCFVLAVPFVWAGIDPTVPGATAVAATAFAVAAAGALVATLADGVPLIVRDYVVDDNISIPVGAGVAMWLAFVVL